MSQGSRFHLSSKSLSEWVAYVWIFVVPSSSWGICPSSLHVVPPTARFWNMSLWWFSLRSFSIVSTRFVGNIFESRKSDHDEDLVGTVGDVGGFSTIQTTKGWSKRKKWSQNHWNISEGRDIFSNNGSEASWWIPITARSSWGISPITVSQAATR